MVMWYWSADTLFWQLSIDNVDVRKFPVLLYKHQWNTRKSFARKSHLSHVKITCYFHKWRYRFRNIFWQVCPVSMLNEPKKVDIKSKHLRIFLGNLWQSSAIFGYLRRSSENVRKYSYDLRATFWESSEIFGKSSKTS